jgi:hypothetical protein
MRMFPTALDVPAFSSPRPVVIEVHQHRSTVKR